MENSVKYNTYRLLVDIISEKHSVNDKLRNEISELKEQIEELEEANLFFREQIGEELAKSNKLREELDNYNNQNK